MKEQKKQKTKKENNLETSTLLLNSQMPLFLVDFQERNID